MFQEDSKNIPVQIRDVRIIERMVAIMLMMPSLLTNSLFNDFFDDDWFGGMDHTADRKPVQARPHNLMKTDVKETDTGYELEMDLPGYKKEDVQAKLENGYLTIQAAHNEENEVKDEANGRYIRKERYSGSCQRSFYVGDAITEEDIKAGFKDGILTIAIPKKDAKQVEQSKFIAIEG